MKRLCRKCKVETDRDKAGNCKPCAKAIKAIYYSANTESIKAKSLEWQRSNPVKYKENRLKNAEKIAAGKRRYYLSNKISADEKTKAWRVNNPEKMKQIYDRGYLNKKAYHAKWREVNKDRLKSYVRNRTERNPLLEKANNCAKTMRYHAAKLNATPIWACKIAIAEIYELAQLRSNATGIKYEVDHIIPLRGKLVCGLHVENNLQVIPMSTNRKKSNGQGTFAGLHV